MYDRSVSGIWSACFLVVCLLLSLPSQANHPAASPLPDKMAVNFYWLNNPGTAYSLQQVIASDQQGDFQPLQSSLSRGYTLDHSWLRMTLSSGMLNHFDYLWLEPSQLNEVDIYYQTGTDATDAASFQKVSLGDHAPSGSRPFLHFRPLFPLKEIRAAQAYPPFKALGEYRVYIRLQTNSSHALKANLLTDAAMIRDSNRYLFFYAGFTTIAFILAAFSMFVAYRLRDRVYLWYACYLLSIMMAYLPITGIFFIVFGSVPSWMSDLFSGGGTGLGFLCLSMLCINLLSAERPLNVWVRGYLYLTAAGGVVQALVSPFDLYVYVGGVIGLNSMLFSVVLTGCFATRLMSGSIGERFVFSALLLTTFGVAINFSRLMGWLPDNLFTTHAFQLTSLLHMLLLNQAFAERVMLAEKRALKAAQASEQKAREMAAGMNQELIKVLESEQTTRLEQERFIDMVSHEYRTPLSILKTNLEILELKERPDWTGRHNLHVMQQAAGRLQEVFDKSIRDAGNKQVLQQQPEELEMVSLLDNLMDEAHLMWQEVRLNYEVDVSHAWYKSLDASLLKTVVFNLIDNARKYTSDPLAIQIRLQESGGTGLVFSVTNPVAEQPLGITAVLAQKYVRGANSAGTSGLGLGLNLVRQIVEQYGDRLELDQAGGFFIAQIMLSATPDAQASVSSFDAGRRVDD